VRRLPNAFRGSSAVEQLAVNEKVVGPIPTPGARLVVLARPSLSEHRKNTSMIKTIPDKRIGQRVTGYGYGTLLPKETQTQIGILLREMEKELPGILWPMPTETLHITLCEIIKPKESSPEDDNFFGEHQREFEEIPARILSDTKKIAVRFAAIEATTQAIIIKGMDDGSIAAIRKQFVDNLPLPQGVRPPNIIHSSIARYMREVDLEHVKKVTAKHHISIEAVISEFDLVKVLIRPAQKMQILKKYFLKELV
jgi:hypothetical protein